MVVSLLLLPTLSYVSFGGFIAFTVIVVFSQPRRFWSLAVRSGWLALALGLVLSSQQAYDLATSYLNLANFVPFMAVTIALGTWLPQHPYPHRQAEAWAGWLLIITVPVHLLAMLEYTLMDPKVKGQLSNLWGLRQFYDANYNFGQRADLLFGNPNTLACYIVFVFALGLGLMMKYSGAQPYTSIDPSPIPRVVGWLTRKPWRLSAITLLNLVGLFSTGSRNGLITAMIIFGLALLTVSGQWRLKGMTALSLGALCACVAIFGAGGRTLTWTLFTQDARLSVWQIAWNHALHYPWLGIGLGNYGVLYTPQSIPGYDAMYHAHNLWLTLLAETGFPLTLALTGLVGLTIYRATRKLPHLPPSHQAIVQGYLWAFGSLTIFSLSDLTIAYPRTTVLGWLALGVIYGIAQPTPYLHLGQVYRLLPKALRPNQPWSR